MTITFQKDEKEIDLITLENLFLNYKMDLSDEKGLSFTSNFSC